MTRSCSLLALLAAASLAAASLAAASLAAAGCGPTPPTAETGEPLTVAVRVDAVADAQIVGASADRRFVAYAWPCPPDTFDAPSLSGRDDWTGVVSQLGPLARCAPNLVTFSSDGKLAAYPPRDGLSAIALAFAVRRARSARRAATAGGAPRTAPAARPSERRACA